jgi:preprotein translocase subunit YajC
MSFFISQAYAAADATKPAQADSVVSLLMISAIFLLFYFMLIRPQNKRAKEQRELLSKLKKGDEVVLSGGIIAKIVQVDDNHVKASLTDGVVVTVQKNSVTTILPKGTLKSL